MPAGVKPLSSLGKNGENQEMKLASVISLTQAFDKLRFYANRTPESSDEELSDAFAELSSYRDGGIFIGHYAGYSEWERHSQGDEIVYVLEGKTTLILLDEFREVTNELEAGQLLVVPQNTWHRFETPEAVRILTVTPQPTDHSQEKPR